MATTIINYSLSDYMAIASLVRDGAPDEFREYEVEYKTGDYSLYLTIDRDAEYRNVRGGSFEGYDFERLSEIESEEFDVIGWDCLNSKGEYALCNFQPKQLTDILN
jgi:hypothetical protein